MTGGSTTGFRGKKRLFILAEPRSGSSWLMETLNSHREIRLMTEIQGPDRKSHLLGEILNPVQNSEINKYIVGSEGDFHDCLEYVEKILAARGGRRERFCGCKILLNQLTFIGAGFAEQFLDFYREAAFIFLYRTNLVAGQISLQLAHERNIWHVKRPDQIALNRVHLSPPVLVTNLEKTLWRREKIRQLLAGKRQPCFAVSYEELFAGPAEVLDKIFAFLGLADRKVVFSREMKSNPFLPRQVVENYREVVAYLESYPHFLQMLLAE
jgi:hypothetical protein